MPCRSKKRCRVRGRSSRSDPLVNPGNPPRRHQARATAHPARLHHHMVTLAAGSSGRSPARAHQKKNATVMLSPLLVLTARTASSALWTRGPHCHFHLLDSGDRRRNRGTCAGGQRYGCAQKRGTLIKKDNSSMAIDIPSQMITNDNAKGFLCKGLAEILGAKRRAPELP
jgi:hypothetical protein